MCNTRSNVYLQSMKTYPLSVNTLMRNLTSERHDNCAPCLGLILPIQWVTPPPNSYLECFLWALHWLSLHIWFIFNIDLSSWWSSLWWFSLTQIYTYICVLSSTAFTYSYVFLFESFDLSECEQTTRQSRHAWEHGTTSNVLHVRHVSLRCERPGAPV